MDALKLNIIKAARSVKKRIGKRRKTLDLENIFIDELIKVGIHESFILPYKERSGFKKSWELITLVREYRVSVSTPKDKYGYAKSIAIRRPVSQSSLLNKIQKMSGLNIGMCNCSNVFIYTIKDSIIMCPKCGKSGKQSDILKAIKNG